MVKTDFIKAMAIKAQMSQEEARVAYEAFMDVLKETLPNEKVILSGFGNFELQHKEARVAMNPKTGEKIDVEEHNVPTFKFCKAFKEMF